MRANERASARRDTAALSVWLLAMARSSYWSSSESLNRVHQEPFGMESFGAAGCHGGGVCQFAGTVTSGFAYFGPRAKRNEPLSSQSKIGTNLIVRCSAS